MNTRALDLGSHLPSLQTAVLVECPRCAAPAWIRTVVPEERGWFAPRRLTCGRCGLSRQWHKREIRRAPGTAARDDYFHLPLYLRTPCCGDTLWAYNPEHLEYLARWLEAELRERRPHATAGWSNRSALSRLPKWLKLGKNRPAVRQALAKLKALARQV